jgi:hypothetical protein
MVTVIRKLSMSGIDPSLRRDAPPRRADEIYEWEILIEAPFAFDFFRLVRSLVRLPAPPRDAGSTPRGARRRYYLRVVLYNLGRIALIVGMIPFTMLAFSYVATLPFLLMRALATGIGARAATGVAAFGLIACLSVPVIFFLMMFRPTAYRDAYKRSKVEAMNITHALALFLASGMLEVLIASPALRLRQAFAGSIDSTPQWTLFYADLAMNVLFANLPQKLFGPISDIKTQAGGAAVSLGVLRLLLLFGFVALVRLLAMRLCVSKKELFYGTPDELRSYLDFCGKAQARTVRKVIPIRDDELIEVFSKQPKPPGLGEPGLPEPAVAPDDGPRNGSNGVVVEARSRGEATAGGED